MLEKDGQRFTAVCDFCPETYETGEFEFIDAVDAMKREGWKVFKVGGEWFHKCPECQHDDHTGDFEKIE